MIEEVNEFNITQYEDFIKKHPKGLYVHSHRWANVKSDWKFKAVILRNDKAEIIASANVLIRKLPFLYYSLLYCCRGFVCDENDFNSFSELLDAIIKIGKNYNAFCIKIDPEIEITNKDFKNFLLSKGFAEQNPNCLHFENVQPRYVYCLDCENKSQQEVFTNFESDYRRKIRKAQKNGIEVKVCSLDNLDDFYELMKQTGQRDCFKIRPKSYFEKMLKSFDSDARLYIAFHNDKAVSGAVAVKSGQNVMKYQYGASSDLNKNLYSSHLIQWEMIKWAIECGCRIYDFGGISGDCTNKNSSDYGLWQFKHGFNGYIKEFVGEFDYIINKPIYKLYKLAVKVLK